MEHELAAEAAHGRERAGRGRGVHLVVDGLAAGLKQRRQRHDRRRTEAGRQIHLDLGHRDRHLQAVRLDDHRVPGPLQRAEAAHEEQPGAEQRTRSIAAHGQRSSPGLACVSRLSHPLCVHNPTPRGTSIVCPWGRQSVSRSRQRNAPFSGAFLPRTVPSTVTHRPAHGEGGGFGRESPPVRGAFQMKVRNSLTIVGVPSRWRSLSPPGQDGGNTGW